MQADTTFCFCVPNCMKNGEHLKLPYTKTLAQLAKHFYTASMT